MKIADILNEAVRRNASDILISAGSPITYHVYGLLEPHQAGRKLTPEESEDLTYQLLNSDQRKEFETERELDLAFQLQDISRFRVSVYRQKGTVASALRLVPLRIPHYTEIGVTERLLT